MARGRLLDVSRHESRHPVAWPALCLDLKSQFRRSSRQGWPHASGLAGYCGSGSNRGSLCGHSRLELSDMKNMLLEEVEYKVEETPRGVWRRFAYPTGELFEEFTSHSRVLDMPFLHYTRGRCPETGKRVVAKGFIAIGRIA